MHRAITLLAFLPLSALADHGPVPMPPPDPSLPVLHWTIQYTGFLDHSTGLYAPDATLTGSFKAQDLNRDGIIQKSELREFEFGGRSFVGDNTCNWSRYLSCDFSSFQYTNGTLQFDIEWWGNDDAYMGWGGTAISGDRYSSYLYRLEGSWTTSYSWTPQTTFTIAGPPISPVPEPSVTAMLAIGLGGLALVRSRRGRRQPAETRFIPN